MRFPRARYVAYLVFFAVLTVAVIDSHRDQFGKLFPSLNSAPPANKAPAVGEPGPNPTAAPAGSKLPTVVRLGSNPPRAPAGSAPANLIEIVDGETFRVDGQPYRLVGIDAPESGPRAKCLAERELAARAARRLLEIAAGGNLMLERVSCACPAGTEGTLACNQGRLCGALWSANRNVGQMLINEGLAKKYDCSAGRCPPKQKWC